MSLNHDFYLVSIKDFGHDEYWHAHTLNPEVRINDDHLRYLADTIRWIPTYNPARKESYKGLCWYGPTVIRLDGAAITRDVFHKWANLFAFGPETLDMSNYHSMGDEHPDGYYDRLKISRDKFVGKLNKIAVFAERIIETEGELYILHYGI